MVFQLLGKNLEKGILNWKKLEEVWHNGKKIRPEKKPGYTPWPNTMAYFPLISDADDRSGHNNHWVAYNVNWNNGGVMNGNAHIVLPNTLPSTRNTPTTLNLWFKKHTANQESQLFSNWVTNGRYFIAATNNWRVTYNNESYNLDAQSPQDTEWHLYTFTYSAGVWTLYIDWILKWTTAPSFNGLQNGQWSYYIGRQGNNYAKWIFREAIIENKARSREEVVNYYKSSYWMFHDWELEWQPWPQTLAYYPLKENTADYSGKNNHGQLSNVSFNNNRAVLSGNWYILSNINQLRFTFHAFVKLNHTIWYQILYRYSDVSGNDISRIYLTGYGQITIAVNGSTYNTWIWIDGNEHLYSIVYTNDTVKLYIDGILKFSKQFWTINPVSWAKFCIGNRWYNPNEWLVWTIREVVIDEKIRLDSEILKFYNIKRLELWL